MKFYLNNTEVQVEVAPIITETLDETLDSASVVLKVNSQRLPYAPMQSFRIETDNETFNFVVASDTVELFSFNPLLYKHTLSLVQNTRVLSKHLVRNSSFTQPARPFKQGYYAGTQLSTYGNDDLPLATGTGGSHIGLSLDSKEKIKNTYIQVDVFAGIDGKVEKIKSLSDLETKSGKTTGSFTQLAFYINWTIDGTTNYSSLITGDLEYGKKVPLSIIQEKLELGATDVYISTDPTNDKRLFTFDDATGFSKFPKFITYQIRTYAETYYHTAYDILDLLIKRQKRKSSDKEDAALFTLPSANTDLYNLLTNTVAPNFTFTQCTMYECVAEVFRLYDAIFTMDQNGVLGIEYFNDNDKSTVLSSANKMAGMNISISEDRYTNQLVAYYQDARQERVFPSENGSALLRSEGLGVAEQTDHNFIVDKPIYQITKLEFIPSSIQLYYDTQLIHGAYFTGSEDFAIDITDFVQESSIWSLLSTSNDDPNNYVSTSAYLQKNSLQFTQGDNKVRCGDYYSTWWGGQYSILENAVDSALYKLWGINDISTYQASRLKLYVENTLFHNAKFRLTFQTTIDGRIATQSIESKTDGQTLINQNNGAVDLSKMGLNMLGISLKTGVPTLSASMQLKSFSNRLKKGVIYQDELSNKWIVNSATYTIFDNENIQAQISFVKNFNALSQRIRLNQEKRLSNVANELTQKSEDNIFDYVYFSGSIMTSSGTDIYLGWANASYNITRTFYDDSSSSSSYSYAVATTYENGTTINSVYVPLAIYGAGNSICYEMSFDSPLSAGNQTKYIETTEWFGTNKYDTKAVKYTNDSGFVDKISIYFNTSNSFGDTFPQTTTPPAYHIRNLEIYKQPNEIFALNYQLCFLPYDTDKDFLGQEFIKNNYFLKDFQDKKFYIYYSNNKYSVLDTKGDGNRKEITSVVIGDLVAFDSFSLQFNHDTIATNTSFAICDEDGNIYFAFNRAVVGSSTKVYFKTRNSRI